MGEKSYAICGRKTKDGTPCQRAPLRKGSGACRLHGGASPRGLAHWAWRHGRYARSLPAGLAEAYARSRADPDLISLRDEIAVVDARLSALFNDLPAGAPDWAALQTAWDSMVRAQGANDTMTATAHRAACQALMNEGSRGASLWAEVYAVLDLRRRLADSERRRLEALCANIPADRVLTLVAALATSVRTHVTDPEALQAISDDFERALPPGNRPRAV
jgi:hypothetical protein